MNIELVALDLDGTLLDSAGRLPPRNVAAIARVQAQGVGVILATGKTWWSAVDLIDKLGLTLPGVFSQGLIVREANGSIMREIALEYELVNDVLAYLEGRGLPYIAYNRDGLLTPFSDPYNDNIYGKYGEPDSRVLGPMAGRAEELDINKLLMGDKEDLQARRVDLEQRFGHRVTVYQAVPEYVEIMPPGVSKGAGVGWLLERLGIAPEAVLAIGDGENDIEMLNMAGIGVAVGNAARALQETADAVVSSNDNGGVAEALERYVLRGER
jgi:Cof subfamily protein (haloacid dehalogenase superfamily)